jgi:hypothetical protein
MQLRFTSLAMISLRWDFHPQECAHAGRTRKRPLGFPSGLSCLTAAHILIGRFRSFQTGGLSPDRVLVGDRCLSGQSRTVARTEHDGLPSQ